MLRDQGLLAGLSGFTLIVGLSLVVALIILAFGNELAPRSPDTEGKLAPYACGEPLPPTKVRVNTENFFIYAVYFMIFDVLGFVLATAFASPVNIIVPLFYAGASLISIVILNAKWRP
jgi:NADH:ubiquinone oxidoreductase subunit 3 (subunit A)